MKNLHLKLLLFAFFFFSSDSIFAQVESSCIIADWTFHPNYTLKRNAANYPGKKIDAPIGGNQPYKINGHPIIFFGHDPTQRITDLFKSEILPQKAFTVEFWLLNHVNLPVGTLLSLRGLSASSSPAWYLGYYGDEVVFHINSESGEAETLSAKVKEGWKKYWGHLVGVYNGREMKLFLNGQLLSSSSEVGGELIFPEHSRLEMAGYFEQEPYMEISNLVKSSRIYNRELSLPEIRNRFSELQQRVEKGKLFNDVFHFNAGPYLHYSTQESINMIWETDRLASAKIEYGDKLPFDQSIEINEPAYIQEITIPDLQPEKLYYYQITAIAQDGEKCESGILTFGTAVRDESAFSFCVIGDTESRPHVNHQLGEMIWEERPNFIMHLGDVTDGGKEPHKFEWNYEYFTGITPVASRIPIFPVPGNGEGDLYWYNRYHKLPEPEAYYKFKYGNAEFFMLNSNANEELQKDGKQYEWLKTALENSNAKWKFVAHHHCPYSSDENDFGDTWIGQLTGLGDPKFDDLKILYETAGVDVVFYGHVHAYERSYPLKEGKIDQDNGVVYIKSGGGGGHLEDFTPTHSWFSNKVQRGNHFCRVDIYDHTFSFKMYDIEGRLRDFIDLKK